jgi:PAS domain S-box-containing protein
MVAGDDGRPVDYRFDAVNSLFEDATGLSDPVGKTARELVPGLEQHWIDTYARVALGGETVRFEQGSEAMGRWFEVVATPLAEPRRFAIVFRDATQRHAAEQRQLASEQQIRTLADELPVIAWLHGRNGELLFVNQTYCDYFGVPRDEMVEGRWQALTHPDDGTAYVDDFVAAVRDRRPFVNRVRVRRADGEWRWFESWAQPRFDADGDYLGHIGASLDVTERVELEAQRAATLEAERRARHEAEVLERHADRLSVCVTRDDVARTTLEHLDAVFDLATTAVNLLEDDGIRIVAGASVDPAGVEQYQHVDVDAPLPGPHAVTSNTQEILEGRDALIARYPHLGEMFDQYDLDAMVAIPMRDQTGRAVGAVVAGVPSGRRLDRNDVVLLRELVQRSALAIERATLYEQLRKAHRREREIAVRLQESLLPDDVAIVDGVEIATRYAAADEAMKVGGDWFDTYSWSSGEIAAVVGDVVGHDLEAAATMGRLRAATGALIPDGPPRPGEMLSAIDRCARGRGGVDFVTATGVVLDPATGRLSFASAGHPPPLLVRPDGTTRWLDTAGVPPIGQLDIVDWPHDEVEFAPGSVVVLYTDGLVERRDASLVEGMDRLRAAADILVAGTDLAASLDTLLAAMLDGAASDDDVIAVALRRTR